MRRVTLAVVAIALVPGPAPATTPDITELTVSFDVVNKNDSLAPCESDGQGYTVVGSLVAPTAMLDDPDPGVTVYLSTSANLSVWHFVEMGGLDHISEMAKLGHASLSLDQLGYGRSDIPDGRMVCLGSQADIAAQVADQLRTGDYTSSGASPAFARVTAAGLSMSGNVVETVAYSFPMAFDEYIIAGWAPPVVRPEIAYAAAAAVRLGARCAGSPSSKYQGSAGGYAYYFDAGELPLSSLYYDADPAVIDGLDRLRERDACGIVASQGPAAVGSISALERASSPILILLGDHDVFGSPRTYASRFSGSADVRWCELPGAGHLWMVERRAAAARALIADWLDGAELGSPAGCGVDGGS